MPEAQGKKIIPGESGGIILMLAIHMGMRTDKITSSGKCVYCSRQIHDEGKDDVVRNVSWYMKTTVHIRSTTHHRVNYLLAF